MKFILPKQLNLVIPYLQNKEGVWNIHKENSIRTNLQNRYLHAIFNLLSQELGYTKDEVKQIFKRKFLSYKKEVKGKITTFVKGTHELDTKEMTDFIENIRKFSSSELGIYIPAPDEQGFDELITKYYE